jgi:hypothetical protein
MPSRGPSVAGSGRRPPPSPPPLTSTCAPALDLGDDLGAADVAKVGVCQVVSEAPWGTGRGWQGGGGDGLLCKVMGVAWRGATALPPPSPNRAALHLKTRPLPDSTPPQNMPTSAAQACSRPGRSSMCSASVCSRISSSRRQASLSAARFLRRHACTPPLLPGGSGRRAARRLSVGLHPAAQARCSPHLGGRFWGLSPTPRPSAAPLARHPPGLTSLQNCSTSPRQVAARMTSLRKSSTSMRSKYSTWGVGVGGGVGGWEGREGGKVERRSRGGRSGGRSDRRRSGRGRTTASAGGAGGRDAPTPSHLLAAGVRLDVLLLVGQAAQHGAAADLEGGRRGRGARQGRCRLARRRLGLRKRAAGLPFPALWTAPAPAPARRPRAWSVSRWHAPLQRPSMSSRHATRRRWLRR